MMFYDVDKGILTVYLDALNNGKTMVTFQKK